MAEIVITISGERGVGKTTIMNTIQKHLESKGFKFKAELEGRSYEKLVLTIDRIQLDQLQRESK